MDLSETIAPRSDQLNADDLMIEAQTFTVESVSAGTNEQPVNVNLVEMPGRPFKPSKSMRRVLVTSWGPKGDSYAGRALTLYRNPSIRYGGIEVGGIEISHLSHIENKIDIQLTESRTKKRWFTVKPLVQQPVTQQPQPDIGAMIEQCGGDVEQLNQLHEWAKQQGAPQHILDQIPVTQPEGESA